MGFPATWMLFQVFSISPSAILTQAEILLFTMEAIVLLESSSALPVPIGASSMVSDFSRSRLLAISSFSLKESALPRMTAPSRRVISISFIVLILCSFLCATDF